MNTPSKNTLDCSGEQHKANQLQAVKQFLFRNTATMKQVFVGTGIFREHVCRHIAALRDLDQVCKIKEGKCPITGQNGVGFYTTNPKLFISSPQLELFNKKGGPNVK
jgi:hypothetical protein